MRDRRMSLHQVGGNRMRDAGEDAHDVDDALDGPEVGDVHEHAPAVHALLAKDVRVAPAVVDRGIDEVVDDADVARRAAERPDRLVAKMVRDRRDAV